jgi:DNA polymerase-3 subunit delta'
MIVPWLENDWRTLLGRVASGRVPHALLVAGPAGLGKRAFVDALAASLCCEAREPSGGACGRCRACRLLASGTHPDRVAVTFELRDDGTPRTEIVIEQIRALGERLAKTSQFGGLKVATIDPADALNVAAANALLKTLEEPAGDTVLVLVSDQPMRLPATIRSRCQRVDARFPGRDAALAWLAGQGVARGDAEYALALAAGNPGVAAALAAPERRKLLDDVARDLTDLRARRARPADVAAVWLREQPEERLLLAAELTRLLAWAANGAGRLPPGLGAHVGLTRPVEMHKLAAWWDRANRVRLQLKTPLRAELLLFEVLRDWRDLARAAAA